MPILYALVARGKTVLAEFTSTSGNFPTVTRFLLARIGDRTNTHTQTQTQTEAGSDGSTKMSIIYDQHIFHYVVEEGTGMVYLCMVDDTETKRRVPFLFLEEIQRRFTAAYGESAQTAIAFAMNESFSPTLKLMMDYYNSEPGAGDNIQQLKSKVEETKGVMVENIDQVLGRGEKIELLVDKTDRLSQQAVQFKRQSRKLQQSMWWRRVNRYVIGAFVLVLVIFLITALGCGGLSFKKCKKK